MNAPLRPGPGHNSPAAFRGSFADFTIVKSRKVARFVVEVALEDADAALEAMGGLPRPDMERWVAVARLNLEGGDATSERTEHPSRAQASDAAPVATTHHGGRGERPKQRWGEMSRAQQAGVLCDDPQFQNWLIKWSPIAWEYAEDALMADEAPTSSKLAAEVVRALCHVPSRRDLDADEVASKYWDAIVTEYRTDTGQMAEDRS